MVGSGRSDHRLRRSGPSVSPANDRLSGTQMLTVHHMPKVVYSCFTRECEACVLSRIAGSRVAAQRESRAPEAAFSR